VRVPALVLVAALAFGCAFPAAKSRIEPQERVWLELSGAAAPLDVQGSNLDSREVAARFRELIKRELIKRRSLAPSSTRADVQLAVRLVGISLAAKGADDAALRRSKHPLEYASCGSYFKNPSREMPAARLIEDAGLKGLRVGRAHVSEKHANFLVAEPAATADDITALAAEVVRRVKETSGYELIEEVRRLGFA